MWSLENLWGQLVDEKDMRDSAKMRFCYKVRVLAWHDQKLAADRALLKTEQVFLSDAAGELEGQIRRRLAVMWTIEQWIFRHSGIIAPEAEGAD